MRGILDDKALVQAARKRILRELEAQHMASQIHNTINNSQGDRGGGGGGGLMEAMNGGGKEDPELYDYLVDIEKRDIPGEEEGSKPVGWTKKVHRHRDLKGRSGK